MSVFVTPELCGSQVSPPSVVATTAPCAPTAQQLLKVEQVSALSVDAGGFCSFHPLAA